ncbi:UNVERIFIED_CONTAM: hypothetical protein GTU68_036062 [Idotea baltica]|nr:hypothetical protein [Idotea baltica]
MPNIKLKIEYNGAGFSGWQIQPKTRTIQGELTKNISLVIGEKISIIASGRTDSGVHALGQVVNFRCKKDPDLKKLAYSISSLMRDEVSILEARIVDNEFHSQQDSIKKHYRYTILNRKPRPVLNSNLLWYYPFDIDRKKLIGAAKEFEGEMDFKSFQASGCTARTTKRTIYESKITINGDLIYYDVIGNGFLKQMVRNIVGTIIDNAAGKLRYGSIKEVIKSLDRRNAGVTAPAHGLTLMKVYY